jgi:hypothetical protein
LDDATRGANITARGGATVVVVVKVLVVEELVVNVLVVEELVVKVLEVDISWPVVDDSKDKDGR